MTDRASWLNVSAFAQRIGISRRTTYNWLYAGKLRWDRTVTGVLRIDPDSAYESDTGPRTPWRSRAEAA